MNINFVNSFTDSLDRIAWQNTSIYKIYSFLRYDIVRFIKNTWRFRQALNNYRWWDQHGLLMFMEIGFTDMAAKVEKHGIEIDTSRLKKVAAMRRAAQLIKNYNEDLYIEMAERELGEIIYRDLEFRPCEDKPGFLELIDNDTPEEKEHNRKVYARARAIEEAEWHELCTILEGQDYTTFDQAKKTWDEQFDGSGLRGWWD